MSELQKQRTIENNLARKGRPVSAEALERIREGVRRRKSRKGMKLGPYSDERLVNLRKTKKSPEHRAKMSAALKGRVFTEEHLRHLSECRIGKKPSPEARANHKAAMNRPDVKAKLAKYKFQPGHAQTKGTTGRKMSEEQKLKISRATKGRPHSSAHQDAVNAAIHTPEVKAKQMEYLKKRWANEKEHKKASEKSFAMWKLPDHHRKVFYNWGKKINKAESKLQNILDELYPGEWEYVGNGKRSVGGKCPDFVHKEKNAVVELFGNYWHKPEEEQQRKDFFIEQGYECAIVWEYTMKERGKEYVSELIGR
jgi:very-short-patch-repair endonuclease